MSNQMEYGWYPECDDCGGGNLNASITICESCLEKMCKLSDNDIADTLKHFLKELKSK